MTLAGSADKLRAMIGQTRAVFEARLRSLGYDAPRPYAFDPCIHAAADECSVFMMPTREEEETAETYGELGWRVYEGCEACCANFASVMFCGGMYTHLDVFVGGALREHSGAPEIRPAAQPVDDENAEG